MKRTDQKNCYVRQYKLCRQTLQIVSSDITNCVVRSRNRKSTRAQQGRKAALVLTSRRASGASKYCRWQGKAQRWRRCLSAAGWGPRCRVSFRRFSSVASTRTEKKNGRGWWKFHREFFSFVITVRRVNWVATNFCHSGNGNMSQDLRQKRRFHFEYYRIKFKNCSWPQRYTLTHYKTILKTKNLKQQSPSPRIFHHVITTNAVSTATWNIDVLDRLTMQI